MLGKDDLQRGWCSVLLGMVALLAVGCADDLYSDCSPDDELNCESGDDSSYSCVAEPDFQCSTQVCAKYQGGRTYCTQSCTSDGECQGGECKRFILGREDKYCVPQDQLDNE